LGNTLWWKASFSWQIRVVSNCYFNGIADELDRFPGKGVFGLNPEPLELADLEEAIAKRDAVANFARAERDTLLNLVEAEELLGFQ
jgi:hypothetical protein